MEESKLVPSGKNRQRRIRHSQPHFCSDMLSLSLYILLRVSNINFLLYLVLVENFLSLYNAQLPEDIRVFGTINKLILRLHAYFDIRLPHSTRKVHSQRSV